MAESLALIGDPLLTGLAVVSVLILLAIVLAAYKLIIRPRCAPVSDASKVDPRYDVLNGHFQFVDSQSEQAQTSKQAEYHD